MYCSLQKFFSYYLYIKKNCNIKKICGIGRGKCKKFKNRFMEQYVFIGLNLYCVWDVFDLFLVINSCDYLWKFLKYISLQWICGMRDVSQKIFDVREKMCDKDQKM